MNILEVYKKYQIMPQLAEHQLKVAVVAEVILDHLSFILGRETIVAACLLHDMGNIVKFDFDYAKERFLGLIDADTLPRWEEVKKEYILKYGQDSHEATMKILEDLKISQSIRELVDCISFDKGAENVNINDFGKKICAYSDMRVGPKGIISLAERFIDLRKRYDSKLKLMGGDENLRLEFEKGLREIEKQIFEHCKIKPEEITEEKIKEKLKILKNFEI